MRSPNAFRRPLAWWWWLAAGAAAVLIAQSVMVLKSIDEASIGTGDTAGPRAASPVRPAERPKLEGETTTHERLSRDECPDRLTVGTRDAAR